VPGDLLVVQRVLTVKGLYHLPPPLPLLFPNGFRAPVLVDGEPASHNQADRQAGDGQSQHHPAALAPARFGWRALRLGLPRLRQAKRRLAHDNPLRRFPPLLFGRDRFSGERAARNERVRRSGLLRPRDSELGQAGGTLDQLAGAVVVETELSPTTGTGNDTIHNSPCTNGDPEQLDRSILYRSGIT